MRYRNTNSISHIFFYVFQHGNTALHEAAWKGFSQTVQILCKWKANAYIKNRGGFAPLHLCCQNGHNETCRVLLLAGCKPDIKNNVCTYLHKFFKRFKKDFVRVNSKKIFKLIQLFSFQYGDTPLHTGARYGHAGVIRILVSADCNPSEQNKVINFSWREKVMTWNYFLLWSRIESVLKKFCQKIKEVMHLWNIHFQIHLVKLVKSDFFEHMYQFRLWAQSHKRNHKARFVFGRKIWEM